jgi:hypothetical protein
MIKSRHRGIQIWKLSSLAVLNRLDKETREELGKLRSIGDLVEQAKEVRLTMRRDALGWGLGVSQPSPSPSPAK